jgi:hypothetical protein
VVKEQQTLSRPDSWSKSSKRCRVLIRGQRAAEPYEQWSKIRIILLIRERRLGARVFRYIPYALKCLNDSPDGSYVTPEATRASVGSLACHGGLLSEVLAHLHHARDIPIEHLACQISKIDLNYSPDGSYVAPEARHWQSQPNMISGIS